MNSPVNVGTRSIKRNRDYDGKVGSRNIQTRDGTNINEINELCAFLRYDIKHSITSHR